MRDFPDIHCLKESHRGNTEIFVLYNKSKSFHLLYQKNTVYPLPEAIQKGCIDKEQDSQRFTVTKKQYESVLKRLENLSIGIVPPWQAGFDGETYRIWLRNGCSESAFTWWGECPLQWQALETVFNTIVSLADDFNDKT
ncbi:MAG: hypothetical protein AAFV90_19035 [Cyanobacteria bacterium J06634_5]